MAPPDSVAGTVILSPDGTRLVYSASVAGGQPRLFTRRLDQPNATELPGTQGAIGALLQFNRGTVNTYCCDKKKDGKRVMATAEFLVKACMELGFVFEYAGKRIGTLPDQSDSRPDLPEQLTLPFDRTFEFSDDKGSVAVSIKRPAGRVELSLSLRATS